MWTATCSPRGLVRINPAENRVTGFVKLSVALVNHGEASIGAGYGGVWVVADGRRSYVRHHHRRFRSCSACDLVRVDPETLRIVSRVHVQPGAAGVRAGEGAVWVTNPLLDLVQKVDPAKGRVVATTKVRNTPRFLAVGEGAVWTLNQGDGSVTRIEPTTGRVSATIAAGIDGEGAISPREVGGSGPVVPRCCSRELTRVRIPSPRSTGRRRGVAP